MATDLDRGIVFFNQMRFDRAEGYFQRAVAAEPENWRAHALLAYCLAANRRAENALHEAAEAVRLAPEQGWSFHALAKARLGAQRLAEAEEAIDEALRLEPRYAWHFALRSAIQYNQKSWQSALVSAESGLRIDPENDSCANLRCMALIQLRRSAEALRMSDAVLGRHPEDALAHATRGWALIQLGDYPQAREQFQESLRLDPRSEYARDGMAQARGGPRAITLPPGRIRLQVVGGWVVLVAVMVAFVLAPRLLIAVDRVSANLMPVALFATATFLVFSWLWAIKRLND